MKTSVMISCFLLISIIGCASGVQKMRKIDPGMTPEQVDEIMGRRDSFKTTEQKGDTFTLYQYTNQFCNAHVSLYEKCDFFIIFKNGKVIETGVKDMRSNAPTMQYMYLFNYGSIDHNVKGTIDHNINIR